MSKTTSTLVSATLALTALSGAAYAHLGGFEIKDGYQPFLNMVQNYNAGQYGLNSGYSAMAPVAITPGTGLWHNINGGFSSGGSISYATGHQWYDRTWVNSGNTMGQMSDQALVLTTGHEGLTGPALKYKYDIDAQDLGGVNPLTTGSAIVTTSFWVRGMMDPGLVGTGYLGNEITFEDSLGNVGFRVGLTKTSGGDMVTYWNGTSMVVTSIAGSAAVYDRWDISFDLAADTVTASYFDFSTSTTHNLVVGAALQNAMADYSHLTFRSTPGINNSKFFSVDDFRFTTNVPAPGAAALAGFAALGIARRRR
ncbi:MAG: hypothetical protein KGS45_04020 [Planctomycetes bacterium]|nr:hypothetical protein [Planctomycetota bacterium]